MQGTIDFCKQIGYTDEQAELIGRMDDLFEEAIKLNLLTGDEAVESGRFVGEIMGKHTGKL